MIVQINLLFSHLLRALVGFDCCCSMMTNFDSPCRAATWLLDSPLNSLGPQAQGTGAKVDLQGPRGPLYYIGHLDIEMIAVLAR